jgi:hypothetical protein
MMLLNVIKCSEQSSALIEVHKSVWSCSTDHYSRHSAEIFLAVCKVSTVVIKHCKLNNNFIQKANAMLHIRLQSEALVMYRRY